MIPTIKLITALSLLATVSAGKLPTRTWTNTAGKTIEAELVGLKDDKVLLKKRGKVYKVPLASLVKADRQFAQKKIARIEKEARKFMGQELLPGQMITFEAPLSEENRSIAAKGAKGWKNQFVAQYSGQWLRDMGKTHDIENVRILLGVPKDFDPAKGCPIFVQWTSTNAKSNVAGGKPYWPTCAKKGWMLVSVEGAPDPKSTWSNAVFLAGIKEFMEQLHRKYKGSENWPVATGGFSGGAKICQWMGGLMNGIQGVNVTGYWLGGCNEARFDYAEMDLNVRKKAYQGAKVFISSGTTDNLVQPNHRSTVKNSCDAAGFKQVRSETYAGGHSINFTHLEQAFDWFVE